MAFDMYHDDQRDFIDHHEEGILEYLDEGKHPQLCVIKKNFYGDPIFTSAQANEVVHELISLRKGIAQDKSLQYLVMVIDRLLPFFSEAYQNGSEARCAGD